MHARMLGAIALVLVSWVASAQEYPAKPITMIVPFAAGGPSDILARNLAIAMGKELRQTIIISNIGGAGGNIGTARAAKAAPDGYTILLHNMGMALSPALFRKLEFDPLTDFEYIGLIGEAPSVLIARPNFPAKDFAELLAYLRASKGTVSFANSGLGGPSHLCGLLFMEATQTTLAMIPYKGSAPAMNDLFGGQVDLLCDSVASAIPPIRAGKVKVYGVTTRTRLRALPDVPTFAEQGLKGFELAVWSALFAPKRTPEPIINRLVAALQGAVRDADFRQSLDKLSYEAIPAERITPAALQAHLKAEIDKWGPIIKRAGLQAD